MRYNYLKIFLKLIVYTYIFHSITTRNTLYFPACSFYLELRSQTLQPMRFLYNIIAYKYLFVQPSHQPASNRGNWEPSVCICLCVLYGESINTSRLLEITVGGFSFNNEIMFSVVLYLQILVMGFRCRVEVHLKVFIR